MLSYVALLLSGVRYYMRRRMLFPSCLVFLFVTGAVSAQSLVEHAPAAASARSEGGGSKESPPRHEARGRAEARPASRAHHHVRRRPSGRDLPLHARR